MTGVHRRLVVAMAMIAGVLFSAGTAAAQTPSPTACAPGTPQGLNTFGLTSRLPYGTRHNFRIDDTDLGWKAEGDVTLQLIVGTRTDGEQVFNIGDRVFVRLALDNPGSVVRLSYMQRNADAENTGAAPADSTLCRQTLDRRVSGFREVYVSECFRLKYRPRGYVVTCGDAGYRMGLLHWTNWNGDRAHGAGTTRVNDCIPFCAGGTYHDYRVRLTAYRLRFCSTGRKPMQYTRLRITYPGSRPGREPRSSVLRLRCL